HERADGGIEGAAGELPDLCAQGEEFPEFAVDFDWALGRKGVEPVDEAGGGEGAEAVVLFVDELKGFFGGGAQKKLVLPVEDEFETRGHGLGGEADDHASLRDGQIFRTFMLLGSYSKAEPSHMERVARSTMT